MQFIFKSRKQPLLILPSLAITRISLPASKSNTSPLFVSPSLDSVPTSSRLPCKQIPPESSNETVSVHDVTSAHAEMMRMHQQLGRLSRFMAIPDSKQLIHYHMHPSFQKSRPHRCPGIQFEHMAL